MIFASIVTNIGLIIIVVTVLSLLPVLVNRDMLMEFSGGSSSKSKMCSTQAEFARKCDNVYRLSCLNTEQEQSKSTFVCRFGLGGMQDSL